MEDTQAITADIYYPVSGNLLVNYNFQDPVATLLSITPLL